MREVNFLFSMRIPRVIALLLSCALLGGLLIFYLPHTRADNPPADAVGAIEGESISVEGPMSVEVVRGQVKTLLRSGSDVKVKAGQARIDLVEGGNITICGPAHFSVLKSGGSLTVALDSGTIHAHVEGSPVLTIYTAQIQARTISIGNAAQDALVGVDTAGAMCIRAIKGAVRIEQQLTGQSVLVPQSGDVTLTNGQLESLRTATGQCNCELMQGSRPAVITPEMSALASTEELKKRAEQKKTASDPPSAVPEQKPEPVYQVFMPPLRYDAKAAVQQEFDPNLIVLVRRVRVRPTLIFQGRVEGDAVAAAAPAKASEKAKPAAAQKPAEESTWTRMKSYIRKLWTPSSQVP